MNIGQRLKALRAARNLSQHDIEKRTGLLRSYVSRVENGRTTPGLEMLQRWAKALEVDVYQLVIDVGVRPEPVPLGALLGLDKRERQLLALFRQADEADRQLMLHVARRVAKKEA